MSHKECVEHYINIINYKSTYIFVKQIYKFENGLNLFYIILFYH